MTMLELLEESPIIAAIKSWEVLALVLHAVLALVGTIIRAVLGCIFGAVFLSTVIIVAVTVFA